MRAREGVRGTWVLEGEAGAAGFALLCTGDPAGPFYIQIKIIKIYKK